MNKILVTGGCGFIGSNFIDYLIRNYKCKIINVDRLSTGGSLENISRETVCSGRYRFFQYDITNKSQMQTVFEVEEGIDAVVNFAAETHVDRSLSDRTSFAHTNVIGTQVLLDHIIHYKIPRFLHISTDEVYGSIDSGKFEETFMLNPCNPYSATKAGAEMCVKAAVHSFGVNAVITRTCNNYGPKQHIEKLIPRIMHLALTGKPVTIYNDGLAVREWIHVQDNCRAVDMILRHGKTGEVYNIGSDVEHTNIEIVRTVLKHLDRTDTPLIYTQDRINDDRRYALNTAKIYKELKWQPEIEFTRGIRETINWYKEHNRWIK